MPHSFVRRPESPDILSDPKQLAARFRWDFYVAFSYNAGGVIFIIGSILFLPSLSEYADIGSWMFIIGSGIYLIVTGYDMFEVLKQRRHSKQPPGFWEKLEYASAWSYLVGTLLFTIGSFFFLSAIGYFTAGAWCFVLGSFLFVVGAVVNVFQIVQEDDILTLQLFNLTAVSFVAGSILFTVASVPYLFQLDTESDRRLIDAFLAWQYIVGSVLFLVGGIFIYLRTLVVTHRKSRTADAYIDAQERKTAEAKAMNNPTELK